MSLIKNTAQPEKRDIFMKNGNESRDVLSDSRKRYRCSWAEIGKYGPRNEPIRLQDSLSCTLKKKTEISQTKSFTAKCEYRLQVFIKFMKLLGYLRLSV